MGNTIRLKGASSLEAKLKALAKGIEKPVNLRVGFLEGATYPDGKGTPVAAVAAWQNFGTGKIPPRPFFTNMVKDKSPDWPAALETNLKATGYNAEQSMELMGVGISGQLEDAIIDTNEPALSPITVMLRGMKGNDPSLVVTGATVGEAARRVREGKTNYGASTKVLNETGHLLHSVDHEVQS